MCPANLATNRQPLELHQLGIERYDSRKRRVMIETYFAVVQVLADMFAISHTRSLQLPRNVSHLVYRLSIRLALA